MVDDSMLDKPQARKRELVTGHWSGKHKRSVRGINLITLLGADGDRKTPVDYRIYNKTGGLTKHDHFLEPPLMAKARGFAPRYFLFDSWHVSLEQLKRVRDQGSRWLTRLLGNRLVTPGDRRKRAIEDAAIAVEGTLVHPQGYGLVRVLRLDAPDGVTEYRANNDLELDAGIRMHYAEISFAIENCHCELKQNCGVEGCLARSQRAQHNRIGLAIRVLLRLRWHFFSTGISGFEAELRLVREEVRLFLAHPFLYLPKL